MRRLAIAAAAVGAMLSLTGCSSDPLTGVVIQKNYEPSHTSISPVTSCGANGCTTGIVVNTTPSCWRVVTEHPDGKHQTDCLDEADWAVVQVGDNLEDTEASK